MSRRFLTIPKFSPVCKCFSCRARILPFASRLPAGVITLERRIMLKNALSGGLVPALGDRTLPFTTWPVWSGSQRRPVEFQPLPKKQAIDLYYRARTLDRLTKQFDKRHGGRIGHAALQVLHCLIFDFLNFRTGRLDPSYDAIARTANLARSTVALALARLKDLGILNWVRRCTKGNDAEGGFQLVQDTNAYVIEPVAYWRDGRHLVEQPPGPQPGTWGEHPPLGSALEQAAGIAAQGDSATAIVATLEAEPDSALAAALARLGRHVGR